MMLEGVDWIDLAHDRDKWRSVVNTVVNGFRKIYSTS